MKDDYVLQLTLSPYQYHALGDAIAGEIDYYERLTPDDLISLELPRGEVEYRLKELRDLYKLLQEQRHDRKPN